MTMPAKINVVIGIIFNAQHEVLIAQRPAHASHGGCWEFPGGKVELNESHMQALQRELQEEVGIDVISAESIMHYAYQYPAYEVILSVWIISEFVGEPIGKEGQPIRWVSIKALSDYIFPQANRRIIDYLNQLATKGALNDLRQ